MERGARTAPRADIARIVAELDQQFVFGKGRQISLALRYPEVYCADNADCIFVNGSCDGFGAVLACKPFDLADEDARWRGAMIGAVYTRPPQRRRGLASDLLRYAVRTLADRAFDFAVLWTDQPAFYARLGWRAADRGMLGEIEGVATRAAAGGSVTRIPAQAIDAGSVERIRRLARGCLTPRSADDYRRLPLPAESVELLAWDEGGDRTAYALLGNHADTGILYEMSGHPDGFPLLWREARRGRRRTLVNDASDSLSQRWLAQHAGLSWQPKPLAMWLPLSAKTDIARAAHWYIPYFDRI